MSILVHIEDLKELALDTRENPEYTFRRRIIYQEMKVFMQKTLQTLATGKLVRGFSIWL